MKGKKVSKGKGGKENGIEGAGGDGIAEAEITSKADLAAFLNNIRDRLTETSAPPIHCLSALNMILSSRQAYQWLDNENKEIARDIWLRLKQSGLQLKNPPMLFGDEEIAAGQTA